jgi:hypothetical protein
MWILFFHFKYFLLFDSFLNLELLCHTCLHEQGTRYVHECQVAVQTHELTEIRAPYCLAPSHSLVFTTAKVARMSLESLKLMI